MKARRIAAGLFFFAAVYGSVSAQTYVWSGIGTGWQGQVTPTNSGSAILDFVTALNQTVPVPGGFLVNTVILDTNGNYQVVPNPAATLPVTFSLTGGIVVPSADQGTLAFDPNIDLGLGGSAVFDSGSGQIIVPGHITGAVTLTLTSSGNGSNGGGVFVFNNTGTGNSYTGSTLLTVGAPGGMVTVSFWNSAPFGSGAVSIFDSADLIAHGARTISNPLTFGTTGAGNTTILKSWDAPLIFSGPVTLGADTILRAQVSQSGVNTADNSGVYLVPGPNARNPIVFTGNLTESGSHHLTIGGGGVVVLDPTTGVNSYTGGTTINGSLVFANANAVPAGAASVVVNATGYAGWGDSTAGSFASFLTNQVSAASTGAVGIDTLPGNAPVVFSDPINLSGFANPVALGTATTAYLTGAITPENSTIYRFGNGGGSLFVQSNLANQPAVSTQLLANSVNPGPPLKLYLQGTDTYTGGTLADSGFVIFDGPNAIPGTGSLTAATTNLANPSTGVGGSYIGYTDATGLSSAAFLARFNAANTWGIVGFDTTAAAGSATTINGVDLTGFNDGTFLGTASRAVLTGTIKPTTVANANAAGGVLRLTAGNGGSLTVSGDLLSANGINAVELGSRDPNPAYSDGTVALTGNNNYTGGTLVNGNGALTIAAAGASPFGPTDGTTTGAITLAPGTGVPIGLEALTGGYTVPNPIVFQAPVGSQAAAGLYLDGGLGLTLSGTISGPGSVNVTNSSATLSGNNSAFSGDLSLFNATVTLAHNNAAGTGTLTFNGLADTVEFAGAATAPTLYGIKGNTGSLVVPNGTVLTFDLSNSANTTDFAGTIDGGGVATTAALVVTGAAPGLGGQNVLYLHGSNNYGGGTTITGYGLLALGLNSSAGTGMVTINAPNGGVLLNSGVVLTNPLTLTSGGLGGFGTFSPSNLTTITLGPGQFVVPGTAGLSLVPAGTLTLAPNVVFANGGMYVWSSQDFSRADGYSTLIIQGNLDIQATAGGFDLQLESFDATGKMGVTPFVPGQSYSLPIAQVAGTITGFNPGDFTINAAGFEGGLFSGTQYSLSVSGNTILLDFAAIPEPSTWALLSGGVGLLAFWVRRRRVAGGTRGGRTPVPWKQISAK